jgi:hypothetical protein
VRRRFSILLDVLVVITVAGVAAIVLTGGFFSRTEGVRISARSPDRGVLIAIGLVALRVAIDRRTGFLGVAGSTWRRLRDRVYQPEADVATSRPLAPGSWFLATSGFCAVGAVLLYPQLAAMHSVPDLGDPLFSIWRMSWVFRQLTGDPRPLFDANIFHPEPLTLTYSDSMLLPSLLAAPLMACGLHPLLVYNILFVSAFLLSAFATYLLAFKWTGSARAAFISGIVFGFYPYRFEHYSHLELQMTVWMPLILLAIDRAIDTLRVRDACVIALSWIAQLYSSLYYGVFFGFYGLAVTAVLCWSRRVGIRRLLKPALATAALAVLLAVPLARPYFAAQARKGTRDVGAVTELSATPADYIRADLRSARYGTITLPGRKPERALFPGLTPLMFSAAGLLPPIGSTRLATLAGMFVAFDGSLGFNGLLYPSLYEWLPPMRGLRVPARFSILVGLSLAILSAFGARRILRRRAGISGHIVFGLLVVAVVVDFQPILRLRPAWQNPPAVYASLAGRPDVVLAEFPFPRQMADLDDNLIYMYFSVWHGTALVNGYSGFFPPDYADVIKELAGFPDADAFRLLRQRGVTHVTVNCAFYGNRCDTIVETLDGMPDVRPLAEARWEGQPVYLYELHTSSAPRFGTGSSR